MKKNKIIIILLLIVGLLLIGIGSYFSFTDVKNNDNSSNDKSDEKTDETEYYEGKWGISAPIKYKDKTYGTVDIVSYGTFTYQILGNTEINEYDIDIMTKDVISAFNSTLASHHDQDYSSLMYLMSQEKTTILEEANSYNRGTRYKIIDISIHSIDLTEEYRQIIMDLRKNVNS